MPLPPPPCHRAFCCLLLVATPLVLHAAANAPRRLSDGYSLRPPGPDPLLGALHLSDSQDSVAPAHIEPALSSAERPGQCRVFQDPAGDKRLSIACLAGLETRFVRTGSSRGLDLGLGLQGRAPSFGFDLDARIFTEHQSPEPFSYDGQYLETQTAGEDSRADYTSYSRFEGATWWESPLGTIAAGRGRQHWGPSYDYPLVFGQWTQPFSHLSWTLSLGDFHVRSLWGELAIDGAGSFRLDTSSRAVFGHRYEWRVVPWLTLGASELLLLHNRQEPLAFLPFVPMFMLKGQSLETQNNGELSFDVDVRVRKGVRVYGEFLVDDLSEPTSLFNDLWKNRWAGTVGTHVSRDFASGLQAGLVAEYSHVEPWVYAHYRWATVQAAHQQVLLGNPNGPNSRSVSARTYAWWKDFTFGTRFEAVWKGLDRGSRWTDTLHDNNEQRKEFLGGGVERNLEWSLDGGWTSRLVAVRIQSSIPLEEADLQRVRLPARFLARLETRL